MQALDLIVRNAGACWPLPRRASDVATRTLAQVHYPTASELPQGPGPLPASISFGPPMQRYLEHGALGDSDEACMRKAASQMDLLHHVAEPATARAPSAHGGRSLPVLSEAEAEAGGDAWQAPASPMCDGTRDTALRGAALPPMRMFTFLRLTKDLIEPASKGHWMHFMSNMRAAGSHNTGS